ncbi:MAG: AraC-like DNA-binding protein [Halieaceae bacterium]|jgi:AraC-like DNA-binding protein
MSHLTRSPSTHNQRQLLNSHEVRLMANDLEKRQGLAQSRLLRGTGVTALQLSNPRHRLTLAQELAIYTRIAHFNHDPTLGLRIGARLNLPNYGILASAMMASATIGEALSLLTEFALLASWASQSTLTTEVSRGRELACLNIFPTAADPQAAILEVESTFASLQTLFNELMGEPVKFAEVQMSHAGSGADLLLYEKVFGCPLRFSAQRNVLLMPRTLLAKMLPNPQPEYRELLLDMCRASTSALTEERGLVAVVRGLLEAEEGSLLSMDQMAARFNQSPRNLRRQLQLAGVTYRGLVDETRYRQAQHLLSSTRLSVESVALSLGYADARSFRTAFKRWNGSTPAGFRQAVTGVRGAILNRNALDHRRVSSDAENYRPKISL